MIEWLYLEFHFKYFQSREETYTKKVCASPTESPTITEFNAISECPWNCKRVDLNVNEHFQINKTTGEIILTSNNTVCKYYTVSKSITSY